MIVGLEELWKTKLQGIRSNAEENKKDDRAWRTAEETAETGITSKSEKRMYDKRPGITPARIVEDTAETGITSKSEELSYDE